LFSHAASMDKPKVDKGGFNLLISHTYLQSYGDISQG
jgi:hypothetical protein